MRRTPFVSRVAHAILCTWLAGCGGSSSSPASPSAAAPTPTPTPAPVATTNVDYEGIFAGGMIAGTLIMSAAVPVTATAARVSEWGTRATASATGVAKFVGAAQPSISLTGTYDTASGEFALRGGSFVVTARVDGEEAVGTITTAVGAGTLAARRSTPGIASTTYCGTYSGSVSGRLNFVLRGDIISGVAVADGDSESISLSGRALNNLVALSWSWDNPTGVGRGSAQGTIAGTGVSGSWSDSDHDSGTWSGSVCPLPSGLVHPTTTRR